MTWEIKEGGCLDVLRTMPSESVQCVVTSPPYFGLRSYLDDDDPDKELEIGLEQTPDQYVAKLVEVFREVRRVLRKDGTVWLNLGDSYNGSGGAGGDYADGGLKEGQPKYPGRKCSGLKPKDLIGIPWRVAFALQADGWWLRQDIVWHKPNPMPESVTDRCTKAHEYIFLFTKSSKYYYDADALREKGTIPAGTLAAKGSEERQNQVNVNARPPEYKEYTGTRNKRSVWTITTKPYAEAHFATFPEELPELCIKAGTSEKGCCPHCRAPWNRITETSKSFESGSGKSGNEIAGKQNLKASDTNSTPDIRKGPVVKTRTIGWKPTCSCPDQEPVPCAVLDIFSGAGTTGVVCVKNNRDYIGIELNPEYAKMSRNRIKATPGSMSKKLESWF